jgi:hypothetical protein
MFIWEGLAGLVLCLFMAVLAIYFYGRHQRDIGYEEGRADRHTAQLAEQTENRAIRTGRHRQGQPRASAPRPPAPPDGDQQPPWYTEIPGPGRPQAARTSGPGTAKLPRFGSIANTLEAAGIRPRLGLPATTGEMAAITDDYIAGMQAEENAYRQGLAS